MIQLYILNFEIILNISVCCDIENSLAPATTNRDSEFHSFVYTNCSIANLLIQPENIWYSHLVSM